MLFNLSRQHTCNLKYCTLTHLVPPLNLFQILRLRNPVLASLIDEASLSSTECLELVLPDHISSESFRAVLSWTYTGATLPVSAEALPNLLLAATEYKISELHTQVMRMVRAAVSVRNALRWLLYASDLPSETELQTAALEYAAAHYGRIRKLFPQDSNELLLQVYTKPELATRLLDAVEKASTAAASKKRKRDAEPPHYTTIPKAEERENTHGTNVPMAARKEAMSTS
eukprot:gene21828-28855_t